MWRLKSRLLRLLVNLSVVIVSITITLLTFEFILRQTEYKYAICKSFYGFPQGYFDSDKKLGFVNARNFVGGNHYFCGPSYPVFTNELGCFDEPYNGEEPVAIALGDSFTWGYSPLDKKWTSVAEKIIRMRILKCGVTGTGTRHQYHTLKRIIETGISPKLVMVMYTDNDWVDDRFSGYELVLEGYRVSSLAGFDLLDGSVQLRDQTTLNNRIKDIKTHLATHRKKGRSVIIQLYKERLHPILSKWFDSLLEYGEYRPETADLPKQFSRQTSPQIIRFKYQVDFWKLYSDLKAKGETRAWLQQSLEDHKNNIRRIAQLCRSVGATFLLIDFADLKAKPEMKDFLKDLKIRYDVVYLDVKQGMRNLNKENRRICWRYNKHWNILGNRLAGQVVGDFIRQHLQ